MITSIDHDACLDDFNFEYFFYYNVQRGATVDDEIETLFNISINSFKIVIILNLCIKLKTLSQKVFVMHE